VSETLIASLAPLGHLRAAINFGNPILANRIGTPARPAGVSVDLAREFARRLGLNVELVEFDAAGKSVDAVTAEQVDIGFFAVDPTRAACIDFTAPYVLIEGSYLVRQDSALTRNEEVDIEGFVVVVGKASAYDLYLTRSLIHAQIIRSATSQKVVNLFLQQKADVAAGVRQQLEDDAKRHAGLRLLPGRFMVIQQAMGLSKSRGKAAADHLRTFVEEIKTSGFVADALKRHGIHGASVAPAADAIC
jgi:polar amino acid transport system substrate-binding protein